MVMVIGRMTHLRNCSGRGEAVFVQFDSLASQVSGLYGERGEAWAAALVDGLEVVYEGQDGGIYRYPGSND